MLDIELSTGNISRAKPCVKGPALTHVMYADDIVLFSKVTRNDAQRIVDCLEKYCSWSGQSINKGKSEIFFSKHTLPCNRRAIKQILHMKSLKKDAVYLRAPMFLPRSPSKDFKFFLDKVEAKLSGWRSRSLYWAGRCTLINSITQAIPNYDLSPFSIPANICDKLDAFSRRFWWKPKEKEGRFFSCKKWDKLCRPKCAGGLGFKKTREVNAAFLAKLAWMVSSGNRSICMEVLRAKYKVRED